MKKRRGMTLVEVLIAATILFVIAMGALSYVYHSAKQKRMAWADMTATRTAQMVIEDWRSTGGQTEARFEKSTIRLNTKPTDRTPN